MTFSHIFPLTEGASGDNTRSLIDQSQMGEQEQVSTVMEEEKVIKEEEIEVVSICKKSHVLKLKNSSIYIHDRLLLKDCP